MKYFHPYELVDKETYEKLGYDSLSLFKPFALQALDDLREFFGVPITVNNWWNGGSFQWRGLRNSSCPQYSAGSQHSIGNAFDLDVQGFTAEQARSRIIECKDHLLLHKIMRLEGGVNWVHFDLLHVVNRIYVFKA
jgi:hypothetical protein